MLTILLPFAKFHNLRGLGSWKQLKALLRFVTITHLVRITPRFCRSISEAWLSLSVGMGIKHFLQPRSLCQVVLREQ